MCWQKVLEVNNQAKKTIKKATRLSSLFCLYLDMEKEVFRKFFQNRLENQIEKLVDEILKRKKAKQDTTALEKEIGAQAV